MDREELVKTPIQNQQIPALEAVNAGICILHAEAWVGEKFLAAWGEVASYRKNHRAATLTSQNVPAPSMSVWPPR
jgi:hypothetical protein